jgi:hypothetical protein
MNAGKTYVLDLESKVFDTFLILKDSAGTKLAENDDISGPNLSSRIVFSPPKSGMFQAVATSFEERGTGPYVLRIRELVSRVSKSEKTK